jgi:hypothetical protein
VRPLLAVAAVAWVAWWLARELASYSGRYWQPRGPAPKDSPRQPGRTPGPFER